MAIQVTSAYSMRKTLRESIPLKSTSFALKNGYRRIYRQGFAKGIFLHDLSRALWSRNRGVDVINWAIIHGHSTSAFRQELDIIPYKARLNFYPGKYSGNIVIENLSNQKIKNIQIHYIINGDWKLVKDNVNDNISLEAGQSLNFDFIAKHNAKSKKSEIPSSDTTSNIEIIHAIFSMQQSEMRVGSDSIDERGFFLPFVTFILQTIRIEILPLF